MVLVTIPGLTTSFTEGSPTQITDRYRLKKVLPVLPKKQDTKMSTKAAPFCVGYVQKNEWDYSKI